MVLRHVDYKAMEYEEEGTSKGFCCSLVYEYILPDEGKKRMVERSGNIRRAERYKLYNGDKCSVQNGS